ncbi:MAG: hypothetical protein LT082_08740 [Comamonas sp.]|nr:hypothetical protein [Comamonas sp.]
MILTSTERAAIQALITLAHATHLALDDSEEFEGPEGRSHGIAGQNFDDICQALDVLEELPDDKPGETLAPGGRAEWALRRLLTAGAVTHQQVAPAAVLVAEVADNLVRDWNRRGKMPGMAWGFRELVEAGILAYLSAVAVAQSDTPAVDTVPVTREDANNYCLILSLLGMEEEGDPVAEIARLQSEIAKRSRHG